VKTFFKILGLAVLGCAFASCVKATAGVVGDDVNSADVQTAIDSRLATFLKQRAPDLKIEPSKCPDHIDVSEGKTVWCSLTVDDVKLPVRVGYFGPPQHLKGKLRRFVL
jgi:hypothetical protein